MARKSMPKKSRTRRPLRENLKVQLPSDYAWKIMSSMTDDLSDSLTKLQFEYAKGVARSRCPLRLGELVEAWSPQSTNSSVVTADNLAATYQIAALLKKFCFPSDNQARRDKALEKFIEGERTCCEFNMTHDLRTLSGTALDVFSYAKRYLSELLGEELPSNDQLTEWSRHGPGANLDTTGRRTTLYDKYKGWPYSCTKGALRYARFAIQSDERWLGALEDDYRRVHNIPPNMIINQQVFWSDVFNVVPGNRITFVPKDAKTDRSIAIEPAMNLFLQLGVDGYIRRRLKRWDVDLDDQMKNQELARRGSRDWCDDDPLVTLDLAAASDTISLEVCRMLLPPWWYDYLVKIRSPQGDCDGEIFCYNKISSMGNGYTFALESAIFFAVLYGVERQTHGTFDREKVAVFGDDLILRRSSAELAVPMLNRFGFRINREKSFTVGPFRESCGADWFNGTPVRPVFLTKQPTDVGALWGDLNRIRRILALRGWGGHKTIDMIRRWIPEKFKGFQGPLSDESFNAYEHVPEPTVEYSRSVYRFPTVVVRRRNEAAGSFLFRKLMHQLRPGPPIIQPVFVKQPRWGGFPIEGAGSVFTVFDPERVTVSKHYSETSTWSSEYTEPRPVWPRPARQR